MSDPNREAFELAATAIGFNTKKIGGRYSLVTQWAWKIWQAARAHAALEHEESMVNPPPPSRCMCGRCRGEEAFKEGQNG